MTAVFEFEGALTDGETWRGLGRYFWTHGRRLAYLGFYARHLPGVLLVMGKYVDRDKFKKVWMRDLVRLFRGMSTRDVEHMADWVVADQLWPKRKKRIVERLHFHLREGHRVVLASGVYEPVLEAFVSKLGPGIEILGTPIEFKDGRATGRLAGPLNVGKVKVDRIFSYLGGAPDYVYGTSFDDLPLLYEAKKVASVVDPDPELGRLALKMGYRIV